MHATTPEGTTLRDYDPSDAETILEINASNQPEVGPMDRAKLDTLASQSLWFPVAVRGAEVVGFAIILTEGASYGSPNYRWFTERNPRFAYVDRIAISKDARSLGIGRAIYSRVVEMARDTDRSVVCAEVNTIPPNDASLAFHARSGFVEVSRQRPYGEDTEVAMLERPVDASRGE